MNDERPRGKVLWIDTETTGIDPKKSSILQIGAIIDVGGQIVEEREFKARPWTGEEVTPNVLEALAVNGLTLEQIREFPDPRVTHRQFCAWLSQYVDKYSKADKFVPAGYRVDFDLDHLREFFNRCNDRYFGSLFFNTSLDVRTYVAEEIRRGLRLPDYKLVTVCRHLGIEFDGAAHDALADIRATRDLYFKLTT